MENKNLFKKYHSKLVLEGVIKALICGFIVGLASSVIPAIITLLINSNGLWLSLVNFNGLWLCIGIGFGIAVAATPIFYFTMFKPSTKKIAQRVDRLGLEERMITMMELEKDDSYIAMRQREDAKAKLGSVSHKQLKLSIFRIPVIVLMVVAVVSASMITVSTISYAEKMPWQDPGLSQYEEGDYVPVDYEAGEGGLIEGQSSQMVLFGENATLVVAVAEDGYAFVKWSDDIETPERLDKNVQDSILVTAFFAPLENNDSGEEQDPGEGEGEVEKPDDDASENNNGGGRYEEVNWVIDGETYYRDVYQEYYDMAMEILAEGGEISPKLRAIIEAYFGIIL